MNSPQAIMQQHGKTFALAAKLLTPASRHDATELYAFARTVDDWVDLETNQDKTQANIAALQASLALGEARIKTVLERHAIADATTQAFLQAQLNDQGERSIADEQALVDYSYGVAGSIGAMMRPILGAPIAGEMHAISLGIAMQMTNIARDVVEDAKRGRVYIPATFFASPISVQQIAQASPEQAQTIFAAIVRLLQTADTYYALAQCGYAQIPLRNRLSIAAAGAMYRAIGVKILQRGESRYWQGRVSIGLLPKMAIALLAIVKTVFLASSSSKQTRKTEEAIALAIASYQG
jgi:15-cis-phytoene synthase